jgi:hypothetical protein
MESRQVDLDKAIWVRVYAREVKELMREFDNDLNKGIRRVV